MRVKELVELIKQEDFELILGVFLDEFSNSTQKQELINDEPEYLDDKKAQMCFLASTVHKLSNDNNLKCPDWIFKDRYYLKKVNTHLILKMKNLSSISGKYRHWSSAAGIITLQKTH